MSRSEGLLEECLDVGVIEGSHEGGLEVLGVFGGEDEGCDCCAELCVVVEHVHQHGACCGRDGGAAGVLCAEEGPLVVVGDVLALGVLVDDEAGALEPVGGREGLGAGRERGLVVGVDAGVAAAVDGVELLVGPGVHGGGAHLADVDAEAAVRAAAVDAHEAAEVHARPLGRGRAAVDADGVLGPRHDGCEPLALARGAGVRRRLDEAAHGAREQVEPLLDEELRAVAVRERAERHRLVARDDVEAEAAAVLLPRARARLAPHDDVLQVERDARLLRVKLALEHAAPVARHHHVPPAPRRLVLHLQVALLLDRHRRERPLLQRQRARALPALAAPARPAEAAPAAPAARRAAPLARWTVVAPEKVPFERHRTPVERVRAPAQTLRAHAADLLRLRTLLRRDTALLIRRRWHHLQGRLWHFRTLDLFVLLLRLFLLSLLRTSLPRFLLFMSLVHRILQCLFPKRCTHLLFTHRRTQALSMTCPVLVLWTRTAVFGRWRLAPTAIRW